MRRRAYALGFAILIGAITTTTAYADEVGHFVPGVVDIRDFAVPEPGFYTAIYNYGYFTDRSNDAGGNKISSITIGGPAGQSVTLGVHINVSAYALAPTFIWVTKKKILGAKYGAYITPTFTNASIEALLSSEIGAGRSASAGQFNIGDIFVQPLWLGWTKKKYDISYGYGFYIPSGKYKVETVTLPVVGAVSAEAPDNTGLGFWTNQNQGALYVYPWADRRLAIENALTWEINQGKRNFDLTPGQNLSWNWGLSQFLPLKKDHTLLLEVGPTGYSSFQVTSDSGTAASQPTVKDHVNAVGLQVGVTSVKRVMSLNFHWLHEFSAVDRFQGDVISVNFVAKLSKE